MAEFKRDEAIIPKRRPGSEDLFNEFIGKFPFDAFQTNADTNEQRELTLRSTWDFIVGNDLTVTNDLNVQNDLDVDRDLNVDRNVQIDGTFDCDGVATFNDPVIMGGNLPVVAGTYNALDVSGSNILVISGSSGNVTINGLTGGSANTILYWYAFMFGNTLTFTHNSGSATDEKIYVEGSANKTLTTFGSGILVNALGSAWVIS